MAPYAKTCLERGGGGGGGGRAPAATVRLFLLFSDLETCSRGCHVRQDWRKIEYGEICCGKIYHRSIVWSSTLIFKGARGWLLPRASPLTRLQYLVHERPWSWLLHTIRRT